MLDTDYEKWVNLFDKKVNDPQSVEILQEIDVGYLSTVYLVSVDGTQYAVKMYHTRYNGTQVLLTEQTHIRKARMSIPKVVPPVVFCSPYTKNEFHREILVMERAYGTPLNNEVFNKQVFEELVNVLTKFHGSRVTHRVEIDEIDRINNCKKVILPFLKENEIISQERFTNHVDALKEYYLEQKAIFTQTTMIHGDLWWDNILVDRERITIIDWLESSEQDYCRDLAQLKLGTLNEILDTHESQRFFEQILTAYREDFKDDSIFERMRYYLPLLYLEESFYLPFKFFPWNIKYEEDADNFRKRFLDYYQKSEWAFTFSQDTPP